MGTELERIAELARKRPGERLTTLMHHVLDTWFMEVVKNHCAGEAHLVRYTDDFVGCFEHRQDAERFHRALIKRLEKFGLEIAEEKTRIIAFGKNAADESKRQNKHKPDTFDFLGFTHYCGKSAKGWFRVKRKTSAKKFRNALASVKEWLHRNLAKPASIIVGELAMKLKGHYQYYGITDNSIMLGNYYDCVRKMLYRWFCRKSQKTGMNWNKYLLYLKRNPLPRGRITAGIYDVRQELVRYVR